jgi:uncharacterized protein
VQQTVAVHEGLFADGDDPHLLGSRCSSCGGHHYPRHRVCAYCSSEDVVEVDLSSTGTLWAWTAVNAPPPGYQGEVPFGFGVVELPEGLRVVPRLTEADPSRLSAGQKMRLVVVPLHMDEEGRQVTVSAFAPSE